MRAIWAIASCMIKQLIRRKDFYVLLIFLLVLLGLLSSQTFFALEEVSRYIRDFGYFMVVFFSLIIAVTFAAKQIPEEIDNRTIYPLLAKPIDRATVILGKYCGSVLVSVFSFMVFYAAYLVFYLTSGTGGSFVLATQGFLMGVLFLFLVSALVIFFSNFLTTSANITLSLLIYMLISGFSESLRELVLYSKGLMAAVTSTLYYMIPHFDFYDMRVRITHAWDPLPFWVMGTITLYTLIYSSMLLYFAGLLFRRRKL
ncbi:MAG: ABC transporter permease subunit [Candidatus Omnitrophica bacterium]|nr:ABC transporter permease subunit [Candidatus Omnitrophota bacterium]